MKYADEVDYELYLKKDGTFELEFRMPVPGNLWIEYAKKYAKKEPPAVVEINPKMFSAIEDSKDFHKILEKIREDASRKFAPRIGAEIGFAAPKVADAKIIRDKKRGDYYLKVSVLGAWAKI